MKERKSSILHILYFASVIAAWDIFVQITNTPSWILPSPTMVFAALWKHKIVLFHHTTVTVFEALSGLFIAIIVACLVAVSIYQSMIVKKILYPAILASQSIPYIAIAPLFSLWFGFGFTPKIIIVTIVCFFPIVVSVIDGFAQVDEKIVQSTRMLGASSMQIFTNVYIPSTVPSFFSGARIGVSYALISATVAEWTGASDGLGVYIVRSSKSFQTDQVFACVFLISALSILFVHLVDKLYKHFVPWKFITN